MRDRPIATRRRIDTAQSAWRRRHPESRKAPIRTSLPVRPTRLPGLYSPPTPIPEWDTRIAAHKGPVAWCGGRPTASSQAARRLGLAAILAPACRQANLPTFSPVSRVGFSELLGRFPKCHLTSRFRSSAAAWVETCANCVPFGTNSIVRTAPAKGLPGRADRDAIVGPCLTGPSG
jgi:hypothetical protein